MAANQTILGVPHGDVTRLVDALHELHADPTDPPVFGMVHAEKISRDVIRARRHSEHGHEQATLRGAAAGVRTRSVLAMSTPAMGLGGAEVLAARSASPWIAATSIALTLVPAAYAAVDAVINHKTSQWSQKFSDWQQREVGYALSDLRVVLEDDLANPPSRAERRRRSSVIRSDPDRDIRPLITDFGKEHGHVVNDEHVLFDTLGNRPHKAGTARRLWDGGFASAVLAEWDGRFQTPVMDAILRFVGEGVRSYPNIAAGPEL